MADEHPWLRHLGGDKQVVKISGDVGCVGTGQLRTAISVAWPIVRKDSGETGNVGNRQPGFHCIAETGFENYGRRSVAGAENSICRLPTCAVSAWAADCGRSREV